MKFRTGVIVGFAVGYVLGAKAGRARYEQLKRIAREIAENDQVSRLVDRSRDLADEQTNRMREMVGDGLEDASDALRRRASGNGGS